MTALFQHSVTKIALTLLALFACVSNIHAEDFENLTVVDANGDALTSTWSLGYGLSNGWKIISGSIQKNSESTDYSLAISSKKGHNESNGYLTSNNTSSNSAHVFIPVQMSGTVKFWAKSNLDSRSKKSSSVKIYEANEDGTVTTNVLYSATPTKGSSVWVEHTLENIEGKYVAINLVYTDLDDFTYGDGGSGSGEDPETPPVFVEKKALTALDFERTSDYEIMANEENKYSASFLVTVRNSGNVTLKKEEISVSITDKNDNVLGTTTHTDTLAVDSTISIPITITTDAGEGGYISLYAKENVTNTYVMANGNKKYANIHVTPYVAQFAISDPNGNKLWSEDNISFGVANKEVTQSVTIKNAGTAPLKVTSLTLPEGFNTPEKSFDVAADSAKEVKITMSATAPYGKKGGNVVIEHSLGTFTFSVSGTTVDPSLYFENFEGDALPEAWIAGEKWSLTTQSDNRYAVQNSNEGATTLTSPRLTVMEGEKLSFEAKRAFSYNAATIKVSYSTDKKAWTEAGVYELTTAFETYQITNIPVGDVFVQFEGKYVAIDNVIGFHLSSNAPMLAVLDCNSNTLADSTAIDLGTITVDSTILYIIRNVGTGTLNVNLMAEGDITINKTSATLTAAQNDTLRITMPVLPYGKKNGMVTIEGEEKTVKIVVNTLSRDPKILFVDFQDQAWPKGWTADEKWNISHESYSSTDYYAEHYDYTGGSSTLTTQKLKMTEGDSLMFRAVRASEINAPALTIYTSTDRQAWTPVANYSETLNVSAETADWKQLKIKATKAGEYFVRFVASNVRIDDIEGFEPIEDYHAVTLSTTLPDSAVINWEYTATANVKNIWADNEEVTVKFFINGEEKASDTYTLAYGESKQVSYSFMPHTVAEGQKAWFELSYGTITTKSEEKVFDIVAESDEANAKTISGTIVLAEDNTWTVAGATITMKAIDQDVIYQTTSDEKGLFSIKIYRSNLQYTLTVTKEGLDDYTQTITYVNDGNDYIIQMTDVQTGISHQHLTPNTHHQSFFDLQGRQTKKAKGIVIINGKKYNKK